MNASNSSLQTRTDPALYRATVTHKGRTVAELTGNDRDQLELSAHCYAIEQGYRRAVVSIRPATLPTGWQS